MSLFALKAGKIIKSRYSLDELVKTYMWQMYGFNSKDDDSHLNSTEVYSEEYLGWRLYIRKTTTGGVHYYEWTIRRGATTHRDPTSASDIPSSVTWAKQAIDYQIEREETELKKRYS